MSSKEAPRLGLVQAALAGKITNDEGAAALGITARKFRRLKRAFGERGLQGLMHGNRGRPPKLRLAESVRAQVVALMTGRYAGLNDSHMSEKLNELEQIEISRESVRQIRVAQQIAPVRRRRAPKHRTRRLREAREGAMVLIDSSQHLWLEDRGPLWNLLGAIDDASGKIIVLHFRQHEDLHGYTGMLRQMITLHGLPCTLYGDRLGVFVRHRPRAGSSGCGRHFRSVSSPGFACATSARSRRPRRSCLSSSATSTHASHWLHASVPRRGAALHARSTPSLPAGTSAWSCATTRSSSPGG